VWGLRDSCEKCGELDHAIHRAAFPIWLRALHSFAANQESFSLVVAGGWAVFKDEFRKDDDGQLELRKYLSLWLDWCRGMYDANSYGQLHALILACCGEVSHVAHPATWNWIGNRLQNAPNRRAVAIDACLGTRHNANENPVMAERPKDDSLWEWRIRAKHHITTAHDGREWVHPEYPRFYLQHFKDTDSWAVIDTSTDLAVTERFKDRIEAAASFLNQGGSRVVWQGQGIP
jgi:hypothetical protein